MAVDAYDLDTSDDRTVKVHKTSAGLVVLLKGHVFIRYNRARDNLWVWRLDAVTQRTQRIALRRFFVLVEMSYNVTQDTRTATGEERTWLTSRTSYNRTQLLPGGVKLMTNDFLRGLPLPAGASAA